MQNKRYQVFVSSTFADLKDERRHVIETLLNLDCIPAGMEWFGAIDEEQFEFIKKVIDDCDYYIVIIGGRYGTISPEGVSYTEKEYEYALSKKLKVLAFLHKDPGAIPSKDTEADASARALLEKFREKLKTGRLVEFWEGKDQLAGKVAVSMSRTIKVHPAVGWVRADQVATFDQLTEVNALRNENERLRSELSDLQGGPKLDGIAGLDDSVELGGTYTPDAPVRPGMASRRPAGEPAKLWTLSITWKDLFAAISPELLSIPADNLVHGILAKALFSRTGRKGHGVNLNDEHFQTVKIHLMALGLIECRLNQSKGGALLLYWHLTQAGEHLMLEARAARPAVAA